MNYLNKKNGKMLEAYKRGTIRIVSDNLELRMIHSSCVESVDEIYRCIIDVLSGKDEYDCTHRSVSMPKLA